MPVCSCCLAADGDSVKSEANLSPEIYFRLLPPGLTLATEASKSLSQPKSQRNKNIFLSNLPISTTATQLVQFLDSMECQVQRIELEERVLKLESVMGAHVECASTTDATKLLHKANKSRGGLVFCGRNIYAAPDRATLNQDRQSLGPFNAVRYDICQRRKSNHHRIVGKRCRFDRRLSPLRRDDRSRRTRSHFD